jgi:REP element-mobilizing transposase RayT
LDLGGFGDLRGLEEALGLVMVRRDIELCAGEHYHFYNRGHNRELIFYQRQNYLFFLERLRRYLVPALDVVAYCLMPTHYHLLVRIKHKQAEKQTSEVSKTSEVSRLTDGGQSNIVFQSSY